MKGLYIHIPFCEHICHYCDFVKRVPKHKEMIDSYLTVLIDEVKSYQSYFKEINTIYIGGGTPSMLDVDQFMRLFEAIKDITPEEFTIEVNPESFHHDKGLLFKKYGVNRISLGVQTFNQDLLSYLNRKHQNIQVYDVIKDLKNIGFNNISIDLIYAIPGQTIKDLQDDLEHISKLNISHVSCYSLILEEKTYFYHQYLKGNFKQLDEDTEANMFQIIMDELKKQGFDHYEISNYAKDNLFSKHNLIYWTLKDYIGVGLGAHGFIDGYRTQNHHLLNNYLVKPIDRKTKQNTADLIQDELIFGLRKMSGVSLDAMKHTYNIDVLKTFPQLEEKIKLGLVEIQEGYLKLTQKGIFLGNQVFMVFI